MDILHPGIRCLLRRVVANDQWFYGSRKLYELTSCGRGFQFEPSSSVERAAGM
jgi:hypothetical protein